MTLAVIPARKGSKELINKNITPLANKPLIQYTIDAALACNFFDRVVVTTDSYEIASMVEARCSVIIRPDKLGLDNVTLLPVIQHALETCEKRYQKQFDTIYTLQPTSPLRSAEDIKKAHDIFEKRKADSLISVEEKRRSLWSLDNGEIVELYQPEVNRQQAIPFYLGNGAIFITKKKILLDGKRIGGKIAIYVMDERSSVDIHSAEDMRLAEWYLTRR